MEAAKRTPPHDDPRMGMVIGKSIEDFDGEQGVIEVVIGRM